MVEVTWASFGETADGREVTRYRLENSSGMVLSVLDYGCTIQSVMVPDKSGRLTDVVLGYDDIAGYEAGTAYFGAFVGRYANRIRRSEFELNGRIYRLVPNDGENHLHGNFSKEIFAADVLPDGVVFRRTSPDGEEGFPGRLEVEVVCRLTDDNSILLEYKAVSDADTMLNLTNHSYFNLNGSGTILGHMLKLRSDSFTEIGEGTIPTGRILPVEGTPFDFRTWKRIGERIDCGHPQLKLGNGYDHNYVLAEHGRAGEGAASYKEAGRGADAYDGVSKFAEIEGDESGIRMECFTTQPGVQLYTGNFVDVDAKAAGKGGVVYPRRAGVCFETQHYPCSPNFPEFPSAVLRQGEEYRQKTVYRFSVGNSH
jgi:aldose 1-epimerase